MKRSLTINLIIIAVAAIGGGLASLRPWRGYQAQRAETERQLSEMKTSERERAALLRQEARFKSSIGHEEKARALGYAQPGQKPADSQ